MLARRTHTQPHVVSNRHAGRCVDEEKQAALLAENEKAIAATLAAKAKSGKKGKKNYERGAGIDDATLVDDLFGGIDLGSSSAKGGKGGKGSGGDDESVTSAASTDLGVLWGGDDDWVVDVGDGTDDEDDGMGGGVETADGDDRIYGAGSSGGGGSKKYGGEKLGALGLEAAALKSASKSEKQMEDLAAVAHQRRADAQKKAAEAAKTAAAKEAQAAAALEAKRADMHGKRAEATAAVEAGRAAAALALEAASTASGGLEGVHEANRAAQEEELMVLEAIFGEEAMDKGDAEEGSLPTSFQLQVEGETAGGTPKTIELRVQLVPEYPSHLPPVAELLEGVSVDDAPSVADSLHALFFKQRQEAGDDCELSECVVVHQWAEWLREEWLANQSD